MSTYQILPLDHEQLIKASVLWNKNQSIAFMKSREEHGCYSNMTGGFDFMFLDIHIPSTEALYQALRFPHLPAAQQEILSAKSGYAAKLVSKKYMPEARHDWLKVNLDLMFWVNWCKFLTHYKFFLNNLPNVFGKFVVELSYKDTFWGAKPAGDFYEGINMLGQIIRGINHQCWLIRKARCTEVILPTFEIPDLTLLGRTISEQTFHLQH